MHINQIKPKRPHTNTFNKRTHTHVLASKLSLKLNEISNSGETEKVSGWKRGWLKDK